MRKVTLLFGAVAIGLAGCNQSDDSATKQAANATPQQPKKAGYCFFKEEELKGWTAKRGKDGNITLKGKAHVQDPRYQAVLGTPTVTGSTAEISPTMGQNSGYEAPGDWWDLTTVIPNSSAVTDVVVTCGTKTSAKLSVPLAKS